MKFLSETGAVRIVDNRKSFEIIRFSIAHQSLKWSDEPKTGAKIEVGLNESCPQQPNDTEIGSNTSKYKWIRCKNGGRFIELKLIDVEAKQTQDCRSKGRSKWSA